MIHREKGHRDKKRRGGRKGHKGWGQGARETGTGSGPGKRDSGKGGVGAGVVAKGLTTLSSYSLLVTNLGLTVRMHNRTNGCGDQGLFTFMWHLRHSNRNRNRPGTKRPETGGKE